MRNLLLVVGDSLRYDDGMEAFDWLRRRGLSYTNVWSHGGATYPALPSLWTGLDVWEHAAVTRAYRPLSPGLDKRLSTLGYNTYVFTENTSTPWFGQLMNDDPPDHGMTMLHIAGLKLEEPWAVLYHSMVPHWPYKYGDAIELPIGWPGEHPEVLPSAYRQAYCDGVRRFSSGVHHLMDAIKPDVTVLTSDHGEAFKEHGQYLHAPWMHYPEQLHVPLIVADGKRKRTDRGLLGLKRVGDILVAAANGKRVRAKDDAVICEDYHEYAINSLVSPGGFLYKNGGVYDLNSDPDCTEFAVEFPEPDTERIAPPIRTDNAIKVDDLDDGVLQERLKKLGYL